MDMPMRTPPQSPLGAMYSSYIGFVKSKNVAGLVSQYTDDCLLISMLTADRQPQYVRGHKQLREFFGRRLLSFENLAVVHNQWAETDNTLMAVEEVSFTPMLISVPSSGSIKSIDSSRPPAGTVYTPGPARGTTPTESSGNAPGSLGTVELYDNWSLGTPGTVELYNNWYLRDGRIALHFAGVVRYPDGTYADGTGFPLGKAPAKHEPPDTPLGRMYCQHIGFIKDKNVAGILNQYTEDALVIGTLTEGRKPRYVRSRDQLRDFFTGNFMGLESLTSRIDQWAEADNALMIVESIDAVATDGSVAHMSFYDNWVLRNGRIGVHFAGVVRYPDGSYA